MSKYIPESDDKKSSLEISAEILIQVTVMFIGLLLIHRIITYIPTYSEQAYPEMNIVYIILATLMITLSLQSKMGEKVSLLAERVYELWNGKPEPKKGKQSSSGAVRVSQPIAQQQMTPPQLHPAMAQSLDGTPIGSLPSNVSNIDSQQQLPNYNAMYQQPQVDTYMEPMAANSVLGGGSFGSSW